MLPRFPIASTRSSPRATPPASSSRTFRRRAGIFCWSRPRPCRPAAHRRRSLRLRLPPPSSLVQVNGSVSAAGTLLTGARIAAVDSAGLPISAPATTADGGFSLLLPPGTASYYLEIGPPNDMDGGVTNSDPLPNYDQVPPVLPVNLPLTAA